MKLGQNVAFLRVKPHRPLKRSVRTITLLLEIRLCALLCYYAAKSMYFAGLLSRPRLGAHRIGARCADRISRSSRTLEELTFEDDVAAAAPLNRHYPLASPIRWVSVRLIEVNWIPHRRRRNEARPLRRDIRPVGDRWGGKPDNLGR
jgi:hypothetical protein